MSLRIAGIFPVNYNMRMHVMLTFLFMGVMVNCDSNKDVLCCYAVMPLCVFVGWTSERSEHKLGIVYYHRGIVDYRKCWNVRNNPMFVDSSIKTVLVASKLAKGHARFLYSNCTRSRVFTSRFFYKFSVDRSVIRGNICGQCLLEGKVVLI